MTLNAIAFYDPQNDDTYIIIKKEFLEETDFDCLCSVEIMDESLDDDWGYDPNYAVDRFIGEVYPNEDSTDWKYRSENGDYSRCARKTVRLLNGTLIEKEEAKREEVDYIEIK